MKGGKQAGRRITGCTGRGTAKSAPLPVVMCCSAPQASLEKVHVTVLARVFGMFMCGYSQTWFGVFWFLKKMKKIAIMWSFSGTLVFSGFSSLCILSRMVYTIKNTYAYILCVCVIVCLRCSNVTLSCTLLISLCSCWLTKWWVFSRKELHCEISKHTATKSVGTVWTNFHTNQNSSPKIRYPFPTHQFVDVGFGDICSSM